MAISTVLEVPLPADLHAVGGATEPHGRELGWVSFARFGCRFGWFLISIWLKRAAACRNAPGSLVRLQAVHRRIVPIAAASRTRVR